MDYPRLALTSRALAEQPRNPLDPASPIYKQLLLDFHAAAPSVTAEVIAMAEVFIAANATTANGAAANKLRKTKRTDAQKLRAVSLDALP